MKREVKSLLIFLAITVILAVPIGCSSPQTSSTTERQTGSIVWTTGVPGDGYYTYATEDAPNKPNGVIEGCVYLLGDPLSDYPPKTEWDNRGFPTLIPGKILVVFGYIEENAPHIYVDSGETWMYSGPYRSSQDKTRTTSDIYFYANGYGTWKFEAPVVNPNTLVRLPNVILKPDAVEWVMYPR